MGNTPHESDNVKVSDLLDYLHISPIKLTRWIIDGRLEITGFLDPGKINPKITNVDDLDATQVSQSKKIFMRDCRVMLWAIRSAKDDTTRDHIEEQLIQALRFLAVDRGAFGELVEMDAPHTPKPPAIDQPNRNESPPEDIEDTIRAIQVGVESDDTLKIRLPGYPFKSFTCDSLGLGKKAWKALFNIASNDPPLYQLGPKYENHRQEYDRNRQTMRRISKKLIAFFNAQFSIGIPEDFIFFERAKDQGVGIYRLKLKTCVDDADRGRFGNIADADLIKMRDHLHDKLIVQVDDELYSQLNDIVMEAMKRRLMTEGEVEELYQALTKLQLDEDQNRKASEKALLQEWYEKPEEGRGPPN